MFLFIHRPFEVWPILGTYHIERVYMIGAIVYWTVFCRKTWVPIRIAIPVFLLACTYFVAAIAGPYASFSDVEDWFKVLVFFVLLTTSIHSERDLRIAVTAFVGFTALYELHSLREYLLGRHKFEMGTRRMMGIDTTLSHPNSFGATVDYGLPWLYPVWTFARDKTQKLVLASLAGVSVACVLLTGSRSSLVGLIAIILAVCVTSKYRWRFLPFILFIPLIFAALRPDLQDRYMSIVDASKGVGFAEQSTEFRVHSFWDGVHNFVEYPLTGAGLESYRVKTGLETHSLYNESIGELGIWGLLVIIGFAWAFFRDFREARLLAMGSNDVGTTFLYRVCLAALGTCLLLFLLGFAGHNLDRYHWLWCGTFSGFAVHFLRIRCLEMSSVPFSSKFQTDSPNKTPYYDGVRDNPIIQ
jgi:hypothetical protein